MPNEMIPVKFHEDTIYSVDFNGEQYTPVKPIVENLGLSWEPQARKLRDNPRWGMIKMIIPSTSGEQETLCIPVRKISGFLASINPDRVDPSLRKKLIRYQEECDEVLYQYWTTGRATKTSVSAVINRDYVQALEYFYRDTCKVRGVQVAFAVDRAWQRIDGVSPLAIGGVQLQAESNDDDPINYVSVTEIGKLFGLSAVKLNPILTGLNLQTAIRKPDKVEQLEDGTTKTTKGKIEYLPTELGEQYGGKRLPKQTGEPEERWHLYWHKEKLPAYLRKVYFKDTNNNEEE